MRALMTGLLVMAALAFAGGAAGASGHRPCPPPGARVIARDKAVRVYEAGTGPNQSVTACLTRNGQRMTLIAARRPGGGFLRGGIIRIAFSGAIVAYEENQHGVDSGSDSITVVDVAARRVIRDVSDVGRYVDAGIIFSLAVTDMVVSPSGAVAWIAAEGRHRELAVRRVRLAPASGPERTLDEGPDIAAEPLKLSAGVLSWWHVGVLRTAPMP